MADALPDPTFGTTVLVSNAQKAGPEGAPFRERLAERYLPAVAAYMRSRVYDRHRAEDLTHDVMARLFDTALMTFQPGRVPFRAWMFGQLVRSVLADDGRRAAAAKRSADHVPYVEGQVPAAAGDDPTADEQAYDRGWAFGVLKQALGETDIRGRFPLAGRLAEVYAANLDVSAADLAAHLFGPDDPRTPDQRADAARVLTFELRAELRPVVQRLIAEESPFPDDPGLSVDAVFFLTGLIKSLPDSLKKKPARR